MRKFLIGLFYMPKVPVVGSLKRPISGVAKVKTTKSRAMAHRMGSAHFEEQPRSLSVRKSLVS